MLAEILTEKNIAKNNQDSFIYKFNLKKWSIVIKSPIIFEETKLWELLFSLKEIEKLNNYEFKNPIKKGDFIFEKDELEIFLSMLSGLKKIERGKELDFIYTKLSTNYLNVLNIDKTLNFDQLKDFVNYMLANNLFSFEMLYTLFSLLEKKIELSTLISSRVYKTYQEELKSFKETLDENKSWELLTIFLSNYHYYSFLNEKKIHPYFFEFF